MSADETASVSRMRDEIEEIPAAVQRLLANSAGQIERAAADLDRIDPQLFVTIARGSSDHGAAFLKYVYEIYAGIPVASLGPSVASIYGSTLKFDRAAGLAISQSGRSPDIVESARRSVLGGATTIALTNDAGSPLGETCTHTVDINAGPETSVAATKTFVNSVVAGLMLLASWQKDQALLAALERLPDHCEEAVHCNWDELVDRMEHENSLYVLGRGPGFAIACEMALKFKETCQIHAEAYSSAEVLHGPVSIVSGGFPVLALAARDASRSAVAAACGDLVRNGADVFAAGNRIAGTTTLPTVVTTHPVTDPLVQIVSFYACIEKLARRRGSNPDQPPHLRKVTETV